MGLFSKLFGKPQNSTPVEPINTTETPPPTPIRIPSYDVLLCSVINGAALAYRYIVPYELTDKEVLANNIQNRIYHMEPVEIDGVFHLFSDGTDIGILHGREDMLRDWISRDDPFVINHHRANDSEGYNVEVAFYRDKRKNNEWREQSVVALTGFKSKSKQETIECISPGRQLDPEDDFDDHVDICCDGDKIGRLPAKIAKRIIEEGCYGVFYEMSEEIDSGNDYGDIICKPYVRIFWNNKAT